MLMSLNNRKTEPKEVIIFLLLFTVMPREAYVKHANTLLFAHI